MKRHTLILAALLALTAATVTGNTLEIKVPVDSTAVGAVAIIPIEGTTAETLHALQVITWPREGVTCLVGRPLPLDTKESPNPPRIVFHATLPGKYLLAVSTTDEDGTLQTAEAVLVVEGEPEPQPNPTPIPPGERSIIVVVESGARTAAEATMLGKLQAYLRTTDLWWRIVDRDTIDGSTDATPEWLSPALAAMKSKGQKVPALVVCVQRAGPENPVSSVVAVESLDVSGEAAIALVKKWGGK